MIHDNQQEGFDDLLAEIDEPDRIPEEVTEDFARRLIRTHVADIPDPLPHWTDIKALLDAKRKGCEIHQDTFDEKRRFDPTTLAQDIVRQQLPPHAMPRYELYSRVRRTPSRQATPRASPPLGCPSDTTAPFIADFCHSFLRSEVPAALRAGRSVFRATGIAMQVLDRTPPNKCER